MAGNDEIKLDYAKAQNRAKAFTKGKDELEGIKTAIGKIAEDLDGGAMIGDGGKAYSQAIKEVFLKSLDKFIQKFEEETKDVNDAIKDMQAADSASKQANASAF